MDREKKDDSIISDENDEEVVFSGGFLNEQTEDFKENVSSPSFDSQDDGDEETVVFAGTVGEKKSGGKRQPTGHSAVRKSKKNSSKVAVITTAFALIAVAAVGIVFAFNYNRNSVPTVVETESEASLTSKQAGVSEKEDSEVSAVPVIRDESAEIKTINTATIVFGDNVTVSGVDLSGKTLSEAYDEMQDKLLDLRDKVDITVSCDGKTANLTEDDFEYDTDISDVLIQAYHYSRGELEKPTVGTVYNDGKTDFIITSVLNKDSIDKVVKKVAKKIEIQPVDAHVKSFEPTKAEKFTYEDGKDGYLVDHNELSSKITDILDQATKTGNITMTSVRTPFKVSLAQIKANTKLIASHYTSAQNVWASNYNMSLAIKSANGYVVKPGETFSFNEMTGDTTNGDLGYVPSTAIVHGEYVQEYGGGICQASTTLYICAMKADMKAVERYAHAYPSVYADRGLDATVDYGNLDMKFKNTKDYPVYIATYVYDYNGDGYDELCVEMYGPLSKEYDEIVPVGWVDAAYDSSYSARGAKVYFKDGKEVKREILPAGTYDYHYDSYSYVSSMIPSDPENGPSDVSPTMSEPEILSPNGCGSNAPVPYGTSAEYLEKAENS